MSDTYIILLHIRVERSPTSNTYYLVSEEMFLNLNFNPYLIRLDSCWVQFVVII